MSGINVSPGQLQVWQAAEADHRRAMHDVIALIDANYTMVYECTGWAPHSAVASVLHAARFGGSRGPQLTVRELGCDVPLLFLRGFSAPIEQRGKVTQVIERAFQGELGGYWSVLAGQVSFHRACAAFEYAWAAAGSPPINVRHAASSVAGAPSSDGSPGSIVDAAQGAQRVQIAYAQEQSLHLEPADPNHPYADGWHGEPM